MKSSSMDPMAMRGEASGYLIDEAEKMAQDKMMYGATGPDGDNGNAMMMDKACCNPGDPKTTGDGSGHWSKHHSTTRSSAFLAGFGESCGLRHHSQRR